MSMGDKPRLLVKDQSALEHVAECGPGKTLTSFEWLYARALLLSDRFHAAMTAVLEPYGEVVPGMIKGFNRALAKGNEYSGQYVGLPGHSSPLTKYLKDVLRTTVMVDNRSTLAAAVRALKVAFPEVASVKNRLAEHTHDVLAVVRFEGLLVEVQFHFQPVLVLKTLSHIGFNLSRMQTESPYDLKTMYDSYWLQSRDLRGVDPATVRDWLLWEL